jgi:anti-sigma factor RsiW
MDHNDIRHKLSEYLDGAVTPQERAAIDEHLMACANCADALRELRKTIEQVKQIEEVDAPAWMTQKIMASVRTAAEERKGLFHRLFFPLAVKLPLQAAALLFVTVTVYYLYSATQPSDRYAEAPQQLAKGEAPTAAPPALQQRTPEVSAPRTEKRDQAPGYRSLDMKYAYEKPAPPEPLDKDTAPAAAREAGTPRPPRTPAPAQTAGTGGPAAPPRGSAGAGTTSATTWSGVRSRVMQGDASGPRVEDREAEEMLAVTEHFVRFDLPDAMKVKGLQLNTRRVPDGLAGLLWLRDMPAYRSSACTQKYLVDVEFSS